MQLAAPETVYRSPSDAEVAAFVGEAVLLPASVSDGYATCELGSLAGPGRCSAPCPARPGSCCGRSSWCSPTAARGVEARVRDVSYFGHDASVRLELVPGGTEVLARVAGHERPRPGSLVRLTVTGEALAYPAGTVPAGTVPTDVILTPSSS